jgi:tetratricopeptide (TPR) repeat protein
MFAVSIVFLALAGSPCGEAFKPVALALRQNEPAQAAALLETIGPPCSNSSSFHELSGIASTMNGKFGAAADELRLAFSLDPALANDPTLFLGYAQVLLETRQTAKLTAFLSAHQRNLSPPLLFSLGTLFAKYRDYSQAIEYLEKIPAAIADDAALFNLGLACSHLRRFEEARGFYFQAIDRHPAYVEAYFRIGLDFAASGHTRKAIPWLMRARAFAPARPDIAYALIEQLATLGYFDTARQVAVQALSSSPAEPLLMVGQGDVLLAQGAQSEAVTSFEAALKQDPKMVSALVGLARVAVAQGKIEEARGKLMEAAALDPDNPAVNGELGSISFEDGNWVDARGYLSKAWSADQSNPQIALRLARTLERLNRPADASRLLLPLTRVLGDSREFHYELLQIYGQLGKNAEAQKEREQVAALQARSEHSLRFEEPKTYAY